MQVARRISGLSDFFGGNRLLSDPLDGFFKPEDSFLWDYVSSLEAAPAQQDDRSTITSAYPTTERMAEASGQTLTSGSPTSPSQDISKTQAKKLKEQAKNRRTQRAFRERQKSKMQRFEQEVSSLQDQLSQVLDEKRKLASRTTALEKVLSFREEHISLLEAGASEAATPSSNEEPLPQTLLKFMEVVEPGTSADFSFQNVSAIPNERIRGLHKSFVAQLAECQASGGEIHGTAAHTRLCELIDAMVEMKRSAQFGAPVLFQKALATAVQGSADGKYPSSQFWQDALVSARLSAESQENIVQAQQTLCAQMNTIVTNRKSLLAILQRSQDPALDQEHENSTAFQEACQASDALRSNFTQEHRAVQEFTLRFWQSMDQVAIARLYVAAFPWPVDTLAICTKIIQQGPQARGRIAPANYNFRQLLQQSTSLSPFRAIGAFSPSPSS
ncbi:hypothetical protein WJX84_002178 [Apatococcus fuscideae]|uniref:BZIP domain-containing protein n=1 Tax=Apatococcus fuscideae TaxID=2026836 RepID=A0AAW1T4S1_9CHLO